MLEQINTKLQGESLDELLRIGVDYLLQQPISSLVEQSFVQKQILLAMETAVQGEQTEQWAKEILTQMRAMAPDTTLSLDADIRAPLESLLKYPISLEEDLCHRLVHHRAIEELMRAVLTESIDDFVQLIRGLIQTTTPKNVSKGFGALKGLRDRAMKATPLGSIAQILERQIQQKASEHVNKSIGGALKKSVQHLCIPENRELQGEYRLHVLQALLNTKSSVYLQQIDELGTDRLVASMSAILAALSKNQAFQDGLATALEQSFELWGEKSAAQLLEESGMGQEWRSETEEMMLKVARTFVATPEFQSWLRDLLA